MKKFLLAGVCILALAGCDAIKDMISPNDQPEASAAVDPTTAAKESFQAQSMILPSADLGKRVRTPKGVTAELTSSETVVVTTASDAPTHSSGRPGGYSIALTPEQEKAFSNSKLKVKILARAPEGAAKMRVAYSTSEVGNSGWRDFELGSDYSVAEFDYRVQPMKAGNGDYIGFLTENGPVEIAAIGFDSEPLPAPPPPAETTETPAAEGTPE